MTQPMGSPGPLCPSFSEEMRKEEREGRAYGRHRGVAEGKGREAVKGGREGKDARENARRKGGLEAEAEEICWCGLGICRIAGKSIPGGGKDPALSGSRGTALPKNRGVWPATALRNDFSHKRKIPPLITLHITYNILIGYNMTMFYLFGNDASALKKTVPDINIRGFLTKITKKVYY